jgi:hypothetical protein
VRKTHFDGQNLKLFESLTRQKILQNHRFLDDGCSYGTFDHWGIYYDHLRNFLLLQKKTGDQTRSANFSTGSDNPWR